MYVMRWCVKLGLLVAACLLSACAGLAVQRNTAAENVEPGTFAPATAAAIAAAGQQGISLHLEVLPASAWAVLEASPAIPVGLAPGLPSKVYVIFDANCPYCADLYRWLQGDAFRGNSMR